MWCRAGAAGRCCRACVAGRRRGGAGAEVEVRRCSCRGGAEQVRCRGAYVWIQRCRQGRCRWYSLASACAEAGAGAGAGAVQVMKVHRNRCQAGAKVQRSADVLSSRC